MEPNKPPPFSQKAIGIAFVAVGLTCLSFLCLYRLEVYPSPWFDEGIVCLAAKNVASGRGYGLPSDLGFALFHPLIQTGPAVVLPIAGIFRIFGVGFFQARLVIMAYALVALVAFYRLTKGIYTPRVALLASVLLVFTFNDEFTSFIPMGRQVLGEIPALALFWLGTGLWFSAWNRPGRWWLWGTGALWGLAMITKVQFALLLPVTLFLFGALDWRLRRQRGISRFLIPLAVSGGCMLAWYGYQASVVGPAEFWHQIAAMGRAGKLHFLYFSLTRALRVAYQVLRAPQALFGIPGMIYSFGLFVKSRRENDLQPVFLASFTAIWLVWYVFFSIGWGRYAFVPLAMSTFFSARLLADLWSWAGRSHPAMGRRIPTTIGQVAVMGVVVIMVLSGLVPMVKRIAESLDSGLKSLVAYLNNLVPTEAVIESWEWQVDVLTPHIYHHPSYNFTNMFTEKLWYGVPLPADIYDPLIWQPEYLIVGPFARWTGIYSSEFLERYCLLLMSAGEYDLYRVRGNR